MDSERCWALTITSSSSVPAAVAVAVSAGAAKTIAVPGAHRTAATAAEILGLGFIASTPRVSCDFLTQTHSACPGGSPYGLLYHHTVNCLNERVIHMVSARL